MHKTKTSAMLCAVLVATTGFSTLASAQDTRQERREARQEARQDARQERRQEARQDRRQELRRDRIQSARIPNWVNTPTANYRDPEPYYGQRRFYDNPQGAYRYDGPRYHGHAQRFYRGGYLPSTYLRPNYYVNWRSYPRLYAPPRGYQWVQVDGDFLLIALATGLIATAVTL